MVCYGIHLAQTMVFNALFCGLAGVLSLFSSQWLVINPWHLFLLFTLIYADLSGKYAPNPS